MGRHMTEALPQTHAAGCCFPTKYTIRYKGQLSAYPHKGIFVSVQRSAYALYSDSYSKMADRWLLD